MMTTDIEKQFFDKFGIEPYDRYYNCIDNLEGECKLEQTCDCCDKSEDVYCYPEITDRILLELLCLINQVDMYYYCEEEFYTSFNYENFKQEVLSKCKRLADKNAFSEVTGENFKRQVQALFKGEQ